MVVGCLDVRQSMCVSGAFMLLSEDRWGKMTEPQIHYHSHCRACCFLISLNWHHIGRRKYVAIPCLWFENSLFVRFWVEAVTANQLREDRWYHDEGQIRTFIHLLVVWVICLHTCWLVWLIKLTHPSNNGGCKKKSQRGVDVVIDTWFYHNEVMSGHTKI